MKKKNLQVQMYQIKINMVYCLYSFNKIMQQFTNIYSINKLNTAFLKTKTAFDLL